MGGANPGIGRRQTQQERSKATRANGKSVRRNEGTRRIELSCPYCAMLVSPITIAGGLYEKREARGVGERALPVPSASRASPPNRETPVCLASLSIRSLCASPASPLSKIG